MLLESVFIPGPHVFLVLILLSLASRGVYNRYCHGINHIPGPISASLTDWWRFVVVAWGWRPELTHIQLHTKYGDVVRIGPRTVIVRDPEAVRKIYGLNAGYIKVVDDTSQCKSGLNS